MVAAQGDVGAGQQGHRFDCRACGEIVSRSMVDLGMSPLCQTQIAPDRLNHAETFYPLHAYVCANCMLVQLDEYVAAESIFSDEYPYFSSYSDTWVRHAERYVEMAIDRFGLDTGSRVCELASNDGYLLQHFVKRRIPCTGVEPTANTAAVAQSRGIDTEVRFFGVDTARDLHARIGAADLILGNNVLAHVPGLNDFVGGMKILLAPGGAITMEFPHLLRLMENNQFDTIYHEHFSYFAFFVVESVFARHDLEMFDVEELATHGGSLRIFAQHAGGPRPIEGRVTELKDRERSFGLNDFAVYDGFAEKVRVTKRRLLSFLIAAHDEGKTVAGYGAPGKGNTLLNYCGIGTDLMAFTVDRNEHKYGTYTPGTRIPIYHPDRIARERPDYVLILPWNLEKEISRQLEFISAWGGRCVVPIPEVRICS